ncbi:MAG: hypothetical protein HY553_09815 [Elusimicrobia bacterium]|nr:hypothetical protein [Elusimicrobiota bacterium]
MAHPRLTELKALLQDRSRPQRERLNALVDRLPALWSFPEDARARLAISLPDESIDYVSPGFAFTGDEQTVQVIAHDTTIGSIQVVYRRPHAFSQEEWDLLSAVADEVGEVVSAEYRPR